MKRNAGIIAAGLGLFFSQTFSPSLMAQTNQISVESEVISTTSTDFLSDADWTSLPEETRRSRLRRSRLARYEESGKGDIAKLADYVEKYQKFNIYDPRLFVFNVKAVHAAETTNGVQLSGEVLVEAYKSGLESVMKGLGFEVLKNEITVLPADLGSRAFAVATTGMATLRKEPRLRAEQINSVPMGGWVRILREAKPSDMTNVRVSPRHAPGSDRVQEKDSSAEWYLAQTLEGYIGFILKGEFDYSDDFKTPDGIVRVPFQTVVKDIKTTVPAGAFVYRNGGEWLLASGEKLPVTVQVSDVRQKLSAEQIRNLSQPLMKTKYVWGGVTEAGIDCSGFSQFIYRTLGGFLPRDAEEQAASGIIVGWGEDVVNKALPGDLIFFRNDSGRIGHVAVSLGGNDIIHSAGRGVHEAKLSDEESTSTKILDGVLFARRPFTGF